jgi:hypothetical protein
MLIANFLDWVAPPEADLSRKHENMKTRKENFVLTRRKRLRCVFQISCFRD